MTKISKSDDGKLLVDGKAFDAADYTLGDDSLESVTGGVRISVKDGPHNVRDLICGECKSADFTILYVIPGSMLYCVCNKCGHGYDIEITD